MAPQLQHIPIQAPGFLGLNTQDSPTGLSPGFASIAENCIIDKLGRIASRKGWEYVTTSGGSALSGSTGITVMHKFTSRAGTETFLSAGNEKVFTGDETLVDDTPGAATITANDWKIVEFNDDAYYFQAGHEPLMWDSSAGDHIRVQDHGSYAGTIPQGNEAIAAFGRLFVADVNNNAYTVYWSDLLQGMVWTGGTSGSIDITKFWPDDDDEIVALAAHNNRLIIFGKTSILVFTGANSPATMQLEDTIKNIGCIARDSVVKVGTDVMFLSASGYRSLARTIQEKSLPFRDISKNVRDDLLVDYQAETEQIKAVYSQEEAFVLLAFLSRNKVYCFDMRQPLEDGSHRTTTWVDIDPQALHRSADGTLYLGQGSGIAQYTGYQDNSSSYKMRYYSSALDFGEEVSSMLKFLKKFGITVIAAQSPTVTLKWGYEYRSNDFSESFTLNTANFGEYNVSEYNTTSEYSASLVLENARVNGSGSGTVVTVGIETDINGTSLSIQKIDIFATIGRLF